MDNNIYFCGPQQNPLSIDNKRFYDMIILMLHDLCHDFDQSKSNPAFKELFVKENANKRLNIISKQFVQPPSNSITTAAHITGGGNVDGTTLKCIHGRNIEVPGKYEDFESLVGLRKFLSAGPNDLEWILNSEYHNVVYLKIIEILMICINIDNINIIYEQIEILNDHHRGDEEKNFAISRLQLYLTQIITFLKDVYPSIITDRREPYLSAYLLIKRLLNPCDDVIIYLINEKYGFDVEFGINERSHDSYLIKLKEDYTTSEYLFDELLKMISKIINNTNIEAPPPYTAFGYIYPSIRSKLEDFRNTEISKYDFSRESVIDIFIQIYRYLTKDYTFYPFTGERNEEASKFSYYYKIIISLLPLHSKEIIETYVIDNPDEYTDVFFSNLIELQRIAIDEKEGMISPEEASDERIKCCPEHPDITLSREIVMTMDDIEHHDYQSIAPVTNQEALQHILQQQGHPTREGGLDGQLPPLEETEIEAWADSIDAAIEAAQEEDEAAFRMQAQVEAEAAAASVQDQQRKISLFFEIKDMIQNRNTYMNEIVGLIHHLKVLNSQPGQNIDIQRQVISDNIIELDSKILNVNNGLQEKILPLIKIFPRIQQFLPGDAGGRLDINSITLKNIEDIYSILSGGGGILIGGARPTSKIQLNYVKYNSIINQIVIKLNKLNGNIFNFENKVGDEGQDDLQILDDQSIDIIIDSDTNEVYSDFINDLQDEGKKHKINTAFRSIFKKIDLNKGDFISKLKEYRDNIKEINNDINFFKGLSDTLELIDNLPFKDYYYVVYALKMGTILDDYIPIRGSIIRVFNEWILTGSDPTGRRDKVLIDIKENINSYIPITLQADSPALPNQLFERINIHIFNLKSIKSNYHIFIDFLKLQKTYYTSGAKGSLTKMELKKH